MIGEITMNIYEKILITIGIILVCVFAICLMTVAIAGVVNLCNCVF